MSLSEYLVVYGIHVYFPVEQQFLIGQFGVLLSYHSFQIVLISWSVGNSSSIVSSLVMLINGTCSKLRVSEECRLRLILVQNAQLLKLLRKVVFNFGKSEFMLDIGALNEFEGLRKL